MEKPGNTIVPRIVSLIHISLEANPSRFREGFFMFRLISDSGFWILGLMGNEA